MIKVLKPLPLPIFNRQHRFKYCCVIIVLREFFPNCRAGYRFSNSLPFNTWVNIVKIINSLGYEAICFGSNDACSQQHLNRLSKYNYFIEDQRICTNFLYEQIQIMQHALLTFSVGGASFISYVFDGLNSLCFDGQLYTTFGRYLNQVLKDRINFYVLPQIQGDLSTKEFTNIWSYLIYSMLRSTIIKIEANNEYRS